jgi:cytochrome P450
MSTSYVQSVPAHVPPECVVDFDYLHPPGAEQDVHLTWRNALQFGPEFVWTPRNGGHWICVRGEALYEIFKDFEHFSSKEISIPPGQSPFPMAPTESDPPEHTAYRALLTPALTPKAVGELEKNARALAISLIDGFIDQGECEFMHDFARRLPIVLFLRMVDLPLDDREKLLEWADALARPNSLEHKAEGARQLFAYMEAVVNERRARPGNDLISKFVHGDVNGRPMQHGEALGMCVNVLAGGLDTVAAAMGFTARFLAESPAHRRQLTENPALIGSAVDELLRRFGVANVARILPRDTVYRGMHFKQGEQILLASWMRGVDEACFERPLEVDFSRPTPIHAGFGNGIHRCPGSFLARTELKVFLEEWLKRIPDFHIKPGDAVRLTSGAVFGVVHLPLAWATH